MDLKCCTTCQETKPTSEFSTAAGKPRSPCLDCKNARNKARLQRMQAEDPEVFRAERSRQHAARETKRQEKRRAIRVAALLEFAKAYDECRAQGMSQDAAVRVAADQVPDQWDYRAAH
jgi:hypothetical protein